MWFTICILGGCSLWIAVLGQEGTRPQPCGQRWKTQRPAHDYPPQKTEAWPNSWPWHKKKATGNMWATLQQNAAVLLIVNHWLSVKSSDATFKESYARVFFLQKLIRLAKALVSSRNAHIKKKKTRLNLDERIEVGVYSAALGPYPFCGGTLIARKWVLTAAHCIVDALQCRHAPYGQFFSYSDVTGYDMAVSVADHKYTLRERPAFTVRVQGVIMHAFYGGKSGGFDIALLKLNREVKRCTFDDIIF